MPAVLRRGREIRYQSIDLTGIITVRIRHTGKCCKAVHHICSDKSQQLLCSFCQIVYSIHHIVGHILDMRDGCLGLFCQHTNFLRHHSKSFSGFSRTCCLNGCIQCQQIRLSRDLHNRFCQNSNLVDYFNFLQCLGQSFVDLFMNGFGTLIILCNILLDSYRTLTDRICFGGTILRTCRNILRCTLNLMRHSIDLFRRCPVSSIPAASSSVVADTSSICSSRA